MAPLFMRYIPIKVRELTDVQIRACGNFSLIETQDAKARMKAGIVDNKDIIEMSERHSRILKAALVCPTYDQLFAALTKNEDLKSFEVQFKELDELIKSLPRGPKKQEVEKQRDGLKIWYNLIIPDNFSSFVVSYSLCINKSDIKKISDEMLLQAAILAKRGHNNPSDHLKGNFTDFMIKDINIQAWNIFDEKMEELKPNASL